ncbi:cytochrome-c peroxidase [Pseudomonas tumuqii]|uniref:cytochrome-c peroxidase n=1 Tax=Pseudomonas tumuqii TaxID=2715755 RepID=UPI0015540AA8|nr:cytochrome c peroxidase [Pseudomonas tumuqii]
MERVATGLFREAWPGRSQLSVAGLSCVLALPFGLAAQVGAAPLDEPIKPIPMVQELDPARTELGRRLFQDVRLSANDSVSCASCHQLASGGADQRAFSRGFSGRQALVNTPTVLNAGFNFRQFWDGRAGSLEAQIDAVIENPVEMGSTWQDVIDKVTAAPHYRTAFAAAYPDGVTQANIENAIATFERSLTTPNSRFDQYLRGDADALSAEEKAGYLKFKQYGCIACHQGVNIGGNMFQKFGVMGDYFQARGNPSEADLGRFRVTGDEADKNVFKVPSLRNVALTAPYFHDATAKTLEEAVDVMFKYQLGRVASEADMQSIIKFLETLTGERAGPQP